MRTVPQVFCVTAVAIMIIAAQAIISRHGGVAAEPLELATGTLMPEPWEVDPFQLTDQNGEVVNLDRLRDHWTFVYLGYTFCPDVCPTTLASLGAVDKRLAADDRNTHVQYLFVSVDPNRDTPERLSEYVGYFGDRFTGATGDPEALEDFANSIGQVFNVPESPEDENYLVDHSSIIALFDPDAKLYAIFRSPHVADEIESSFRSILDYVDG